MYRHINIYLGILDTQYLASRERRKQQNDVQFEFHFLNSLRKADYFSHALSFNFP